PDRSIGQSIGHLEDAPAKRQALCSLVELYRGRLWDKTAGGGWNSLRMYFIQLLQSSETGKARELLSKAEKTLVQMKVLFPDARSSGWRVLEMHVAAMHSELKEK
ncbi:MAG: hypothetical protein ABI142_05330, partial [Bryocella sp.]